MNTTISAIKVQPVALSKHENDLLHDMAGMVAHYGHPVGIEHVAEWYGLDATKNLSRTRNALKRLAHHGLIQRARKPGAQPAFVYAHIGYPLIPWLGDTSGVVLDVLKAMAKGGVVDASVPDICKATSLSYYTAQAALEKLKQKGRISHIGWAPTGGAPKKTWAIKK